MRYAVCSMQYVEAYEVCRGDLLVLEEGMQYAVCSMQCVEAYVVCRSDLLVLGRVCST